ncbi:MAG: hypothetical protein ACI9V1_001413 [Spirosomataceae bacterium]|jgi:hypothetical protein
MRKFTGLALIAALFIAEGVVGQEKSNNGLNPLSLRPTHTSNVMYKTTLWRRVDLREKINQPMFAKGAEITKHLIDGVKAGVLDAYDNDSLNTKLTLEQFNERLFRKFEGGGLSEAEIAAGFGTEGEDDGWGGTTATEGADDGWGNEAAKPMATSGMPGPARTAAVNPTSQSGYEMFANELYLIEIREDWIFDKQRSRQYNDIQTITIMVPAEGSADGLEKPLASFRYKDLEIYFRSNPNCIWYNVANTAQHKNLADAFELRLFHGRIIKKSDPRNRYLDDIYKSPKAGLLKSQELEFELMEKEHNLWEY